MTNNPAAMPRIERHIIDTYFYLRLGMGLLALVFPLVLSVGGAFLGIPLQESMSAYYHTEMRNIFVGILFAIAFSLWRYKGFTRKEDRALDLAAFLAIGVACYWLGKTWEIRQTNADTRYTPPEIRSAPEASPTVLIQPSGGKT